MSVSSEVVAGSSVTIHLSSDGLYTPELQCYRFIILSIWLREILLSIAMVSMPLLVYDISAVL